MRLLPDDNCIIQEERTHNSCRFSQAVVSSLPCYQSASPLVAEGRFVEILHLCPDNFFFLSAVGFLHFVLSTLFFVERRMRISSMLRSLSLKCLEIGSLASLLLSMICTFDGAGNTLGNLIGSVAWSVSSVLLATAAFVSSMGLMETKWI